MMDVTMNTTNNCVLKFEHRSTIREVGTKDSHQRNVLKCGGKVGTSELF